MHKMETKTLIAEIFNATTHGIGTLLGIIGLIFLIVKGIHISTLNIISYTIYGVTLILLFLFSTLYHSLSFTKAKKIMRVFDHSAIYLLIAGSYTPYCLLAVKGTQGWLMCFIIWIIALIGIIVKCFNIGKNVLLSSILYLGMGWLSLLLIVPLYQAIGFNGILLLVLGGISYSIGTIFYNMKKIEFMHVIWHLFVMLGAGFMYFSIFLYV
ncbi:hemolysin III family protein [Granulicatella sp. zg-ZJ]|uniref:PAQR family membrane homeostasis protein TrhA n=1 Tax=Granulicatella sp. zg-ZJ TaxID=2678504 RepID=UPI0013D333BA|nr:hemolysin III family protein [Granulicatella sp. zg-ZJ]NEW62902.1 hemolysin III family protein [Granulicatella sp. zg-ZJ]